MGTYWGEGATLQLYTGYTELSFAGVFYTSLSCVFYTSKLVCTFCQMKPYLHTKF